MSTIPTIAERAIGIPPLELGDGEPSASRKSQATILIERAGDAELFHDPDGNAFARVEVNGHSEVVSIRNKGFRRWLARRYYKIEAKAPSAQSLQDAIGVLEGQALYDGAGQSVHIRCAEQDGRVYIDLCNDRWQVVEVGVDGWRVLDRSPVLFRRAKSMLPLPIPVAGGTVDELRNFLNINDADWPLVAGWLAGALRPRGPYPVLAVHGEQGSAKSTTCRVLRSLVDPNGAPLRCEPREPRDLAIAANNGWIVALDNLSYVRPQLSDGLCRLSTGGGFATRALYENDEEQIFDAQRPVIINGIEELASRSDLLDRCVLLNLPRIDTDQRIAETELWRRFEEARPRIFGALLTAISSALKHLPQTRLANSPRMADFALWATAAEPGLGLQTGEFLSAYTANRADGNDLAIEACPVGKAIVLFVDGLGADEFSPPYWSGTATELLTELSALVDEQTRRSKAWPSGPTALGGAVRRLAPNLRAAGVDVDFTRETSRKRKREIVLAKAERRGDSSSASSTSFEPPVLLCKTADANADANCAAVSPSSEETCVFPGKHRPSDATDSADANLRLCSDSEGVPF
jgi:hypothetical protein